MRIDISMLVNEDPISYKTGGKAIKDRVAAAVDAFFAERARVKGTEHILIMGVDPNGLEVYGGPGRYEPSPKTCAGTRKIGSVRLVRSHSVPW